MKHEGAWQRGAWGQKLDPSAEHMPRCSIVSPGGRDASFFPQRKYSFPKACAYGLYPPAECTSILLQKINLSIETAFF